MLQGSKKRQVYDDDDVGSSYRWEKGVGGNWDEVREDDAGNILVLSSERERSKHAKQQRITESIRRGLIRYLVVALDCSFAAAEKDLKPCRLEAVKASLKRFVRDFFDQTPISQLSLCTTRSGIAQKITDLSGNPKNHEQKLTELSKMDGFASLQNTPTLSITILKHIPDYGHREVLVVYSSLSTCDPGDIFATLAEAVRAKIRINVICIAAEIFIAKHMAEVTGGTFAVATDVVHLAELLGELTVPPPELQGRDGSTLTTDFIYLGFPKRIFGSYPSFGFDGNAMTLFSTAYVCPRCFAHSSEIPTRCAVCKLQLNSSSHIARSHHHLFPVQNFAEVNIIVNTEGDLIAYKIDEPATVEDSSSRTSAGNNRLVNGSTTETHVVDNSSNKNHRNSSSGSSSSSGSYGAKATPGSAANGRGQSEETQTVAIEIGTTAGGTSPRSDLIGLARACSGCLESFTSNSMVMQCPGCQLLYCAECDLFIHNSLHNCPGCV